MTTTKTTKIAAGALLAVLLAFAAAVTALVAAPNTAYAAKGDPYTYTVRVWGGNQGLVSADGGEYGEVAEITGIKVGANFSISDHFKVKLNDRESGKPEYYVKGFRLGGTDNQNTDGSSNLRDNVYVTEDMDYVVSYGVKGDQVKYTVRFLEQNTNNVLADPIEFYGNVGDKPVASFEYITGYRPLYRNITGTLKAKDSDNVWTFYYVKLAEGETEDGGTTTTTTGGTTTTRTTTTTTTTTGGTTTGGTTGGTTTGGTTTGGTTTGGANANASDASASAASAEASSPAAATTQPTTPATEEILDVDNPLASGDDKKDEKADKTDDKKDENKEPETVTVESDQGGISVPVVIGIAALVIALAAGIMYYFMRRNNQHEEDEE